ncbi:putative Cellobiose dehydrogenase [Glarea lozoyensis 74030]|uniref:Putative Cellobiose dehydrogenase n=1 Tax=Glarea lozoyensis (strain ATCC 74030 / MF5533) TaxID=1104152 RepID=H0ECJ1_GLAL7|nr:putative Cellobiose dehydrogenase [Glarea lozoyensis 74030]
MKTSSFLGGVLAIGLSSLNAIVAQDFASHGIYTEPVTGITFFASEETNGTITGDGEFSTVSWGGFTFGVALPPDALSRDTHEYIGLIIGSTPTGQGGWSGIVHGDDYSAGMPNHLMLLAWPTGNENQIATSFRYSPCQNCLLFDDPAQDSFNASTSKGTFLQGWAQAYVPPTDPKNPLSDFEQHNNGMGEFVIQVQSATHVSYSDWATKTATGPIATGTTTATATISSIPVPTGDAYDYIVVGAGAGGIPMADKLSQSGASVLLIEKGFASSGRWGGTLRPENHWLDGTNLTWFDIPGECNRIWNGGTAGVVCTDTDQMAGCTLGGGTAVNAGLWWKPNPMDWDENFPAGWKSSDMAGATERVFSRIPGTDHPSMDGQRYLQSGYDVIADGLANAGWKYVTANDAPSEKNRTFAHAPHMFSGGERGGPMATYLVTANGRSNFHMWLNTSVERIQRDGGHATGLDVVAFNNGGRVGTVKLAPKGRVVLSAGAFGTPKLLFRSGIGPTDQLQVVKGSSDGDKMIAEKDWINLPVGYNLNDHLNTDTVISHQNVSYYDWPAAWLTPIPSDKDLYLSSRSGPLAQAAPNINPIMWEEITGPDGKVRSMQWQARVEGSNRIPNGISMTLSLYLGRGEVSKGRTTIQKGLNMLVSTIPYGDPNDLAACAQAIDNMVAILSKVPGLTWNLPAPGVSGADYLKSVELSYANVGSRRANHWMGTAKLGTDSGLTGGTSVVDTNTKVYGTDNIFVADASIFPGQVTTNPSALIVTASERAAELILALPV